MRVVLFSNLFVAFRYLAQKKAAGGRYLLGTVAGIALSLIPVVVTLIVADGMIRGITDRFMELGTGHFQVFGYRGTPPDEGGHPEYVEDFTGYAGVISSLKEMPGVRGVWKQRESLGVIAGKGGTTGVNIRAIEPRFWQDEGSLRYITTIAGEPLIEADNEVLLGEELANLTGAEVGKTIRLMTIRKTSGERSVPKTTILKVKGIISSGYHELDAMWCIISYEAGRKILAPAPSGDILVIKVNDPYKNLYSAAMDINRALPSNFWLYKWNDILRSQYTSYEHTRQLLLFIMLLIVTVAAVNVSSATSMLVIERQREIAVLKAFGVSTKNISAIFMWGSFLTGLTGSALGIGMGLTIGCFINQILRALETLINFFSSLFSEWTIHILDPGYYLQTIPIIIDWKTLALIAAFTIICSCVSGLFPAKKAGRTKPLDLIRKF